jgi:phosphoglycolate phosphatase
MRRFDLLVFDWDGTLYDSIDWIVDCLLRAGEACGLGEIDSDDARGGIGLSLDRAMKALFPDADLESLKKLMRVYRAAYLERPYGSEGLIDGVAQLLQDLSRSGYKLAIASGKSRRELDRAINATDLEGTYQAVRCADETASKPNPLMLFQINQLLDVPFERTLMIGDSIHDLKMAENAGVAAAAVACGANTRHELMALNPLYCLEGTSELRSLLL